MSQEILMAAMALIEVINKSIANGRATLEDKALLDAMLPHVEMAESVALDNALRAAIASL